MVAGNFLLYWSFYENSTICNSELWLLHIMSQEETLHATVVVDFSRVCSSCNLYLRRQWFAMCRCTVVGWVLSEGSSGRLLHQLSPLCWFVSLAVVYTQLSYCPFFVPLLLIRKHKRQYWTLISFLQTIVDCLWRHRKPDWLVDHSSGRAMAATADAADAAAKAVVITVLFLFYFTCNHVWNKTETKLFSFSFVSVLFQM